MALWPWSLLLLDIHMILHQCCTTSHVKSYEFFIRGPLTCFPLRSILADPAHALFHQPSSHFLIHSLLKFHPLCAFLLSSNIWTALWRPRLPLHPLLSAPVSDGWCGSVFSLWQWWPLSLFEVCGRWGCLSWLKSAEVGEGFFVLFFPLLCFLPSWSNRSLTHNLRSWKWTPFKVCYTIFSLHLNWNYFLFFQSS